MRAWSSNKRDGTLNKIRGLQSFIYKFAVTFTVSSFIAELGQYFPCKCFILRRKTSRLNFSLSFKTHTCLFNFLSLTKQPSRTAKKTSLKVFWIHFNDLHVSSHLSRKPKKDTRNGPAYREKKCYTTSTIPMINYLQVNFWMAAFLIKNNLCSKIFVFSVSQKEFMKRINKLYLLLFSLLLLWKRLCKANSLIYIYVS